MATVKGPMMSWTRRKSSSRHVHKCLRFQLMSEQCFVKLLNVTCWWWAFPSVLRCPFQQDLWGLSCNFLLQSSSLAHYFMVCSLVFLLYRLFQSLQFSISLVQIISEFAVLYFSRTYYFIVRSFVFLWYRSKILHPILETRISGLCP